MDPPFTGVEIGKAASKLKNNKATGIDKIHAEYIKYGPSKLHNEISNLLNKTSETGEYPEVLRLGILNPLTKPPKKKKGKCQANYITIHIKKNTNYNTY